MTILIISIICAVLFVILAVAAMRKTDNRITLFFVYTAVGSLLVGLAGYSPYESFQTENKLRDERKESTQRIELEVTRSSKMIVQLGSVDAYLHYLSIIEPPKQAESE